MHAPPLLHELRQRLLAGVELGERVRALEAADLRFKVLRVALAVERLAALAAGLVVVANAIDDVRAAVATPALAPVNHRPRPIPSWTTSLPAGVGAAGAMSEGSGGRSPR